MAFPTSIEAAEYFLVAYNNLSTTASQIVGISDTTVYGASTTNFPSSGWITIEDEVRSYTGKTSTTFTGCTPGADGTTAAEHASGVAISLTLPAAAYNRIVTELRAVQTALGVSLANILEKTQGVNNNLLWNSSFESFNIDTNLPDHWALLVTPTLAIAASTIFVAKGGNQITITGNGAADEGIQVAGGTSNYIKVMPSTEYSFGFDYKCTAGDTLDVVATSYNGAAAGTAHIDAALTASTETRSTYTFTTDADATNLALIFRAAADTDVAIVAHPKLEEGGVATPYIPPDRDRTTKRIEITNSTPDPACISKYNEHHITAQGDAPTISAPSGTAYDGDKLLFRFEDDGTNRAITWNAIYEAVEALPTTTTASKKLYAGFRYNAADTKWDFIAKSEEA